MPFHSLCSVASITHISLGKNEPNRIFALWNRPQRGKKRPTKRNEPDPDPAGLNFIDPRKVKSTQYFYPSETSEEKSKATSVLEPTSRTKNLPSFTNDSASDIVCDSEQDTTSETASQSSSTQEAFMATLCVPVLEDNIKFVKINMHNMDLGFRNDLIAKTGPNPLFNLEHMSMAQDYRDHVYSVRYIQMKAAMILTVYHRKTQKNWHRAPSLQLLGLASS